MQIILHFVRGKGRIASELGAEVGVFVIEEDNDGIEERIVLILNGIEQGMVEILGELQADLRATLDAVRVEIRIVVSAHMVDTIDGTDGIVLIQDHNTALDVLQGCPIHYAHLIIGAFGSFDDKGEFLLRQGQPPL